MIDRRSALALAAGALALTAAGPSFAQDWKAKYPEIVMAIVPAENASGLIDRFTPFAKYLEKELGTKVTLRVANDYTAVIEGQKNRQIHIGFYGPGSYARAYTVSGGNTVAFATGQNGDGSIGYYSVVYVKADSPYKTLDDLKGKKLGLVDVESTSGYKAPVFFMSREGKAPNKFFAIAQPAGSHENAVLALQQGTVDAATNWWNSDTDSNLTRMINKGMLKKADGTPMKYEDFRIVWKSPLLAASPFAYLNDMPDGLKKAIAQAFYDAQKKDKAAFDKLSDGKDRAFVPVSHKDYLEFIELNKHLEELRRKKS
ncbi:MAG: phosphonate ABC transporter substrate-binding protein [Reyranella sp.]|nr:phosphonate ABC transporter substrate-binding protein [Reyranella sp.]